MQKSHLSNRHYTRDYSRKSRDRPGGHCPTPVLMGKAYSAWKEYLASHGRKFSKRIRAKGIRHINKLMTAEELGIYEENQEKG